MQLRKLEKKACRALLADCRAWDALRRGVEGEGAAVVMRGDVVGENFADEESAVRGGDGGIGRAGGRRGGTAADEAEEIGAALTHEVFDDGAGGGGHPVAEMIVHGLVERRIWIHRVVGVEDGTAEFADGVVILGTEGGVAGGGVVAEEGKERAEDEAVVRAVVEAAAIEGERAVAEAEDGIEVVRQELKAALLGDADGARLEIDAVVVVLAVGGVGFVALQQGHDGKPARPLVEVGHGWLLHQLQCRQNFCECQYHHRQHWRVRHVAQHAKFLEQQNRHHIRQIRD